MVALLATSGCVSGCEQRPALDSAHVRPDEWRGCLTRCPKLLVRDNRMTGGSG